MPDRINFVTQGMDSETLDYHMPNIKKLCEQGGTYHVHCYNSSRGLMYFVSGQYWDDTTPVELNTWIGRKDDKGVFFGWVDSACGISDDGKTTLDGGTNERW